MSSNEIKPFEWLTSSESLLPLIKDLYIEDEPTALHIGCGSSTLGERLVTDLNFQLVVNIDRDQETLALMKERWEKRERRKDLKECMEFKCLDWVKYDDCKLSKKFALALDKSTLDCTLCSDRSTAGLIKFVHDHLRVNGYYIIISFHDGKLLLPLLRDCPGTKWTVTNQVMTRQVEDLISVKKHSLNNDPKSVDCDKLSFNRGEVNVILCKKYDDEESDLNLDLVEKHVHETNDRWFQNLNPLLSSDRKEKLRKLFKGETPLEICYTLLFTDLERESLTYEYFLQDWEAYCETRTHLSKNFMTFATALDFLDVMQ